MSEQIKQLVSEEAVSQLKEVHAELQSISDLSDEGIRLKCLECAVARWGSLESAITMKALQDEQTNPPLLDTAQRYYEWVKGL